MSLCTMVEPKKDYDPEKLHPYYSGLILIKNWTFFELSSQLFLIVCKSRDTVLHKPYKRTVLSGK